MGKTVRFDENSLIALKGRLNEITAGNDEVVSPNDVIILWHGTDIPGILGILKSNSICAKDGVQHGETYGINWFSLKKVDNFCKGVVFSINVPSTDFKSNFKMMNSAEAAAKDDRIDISQYNLKIEKFCDFGREQLNRYYDILVERGERFPVETIRDNIFYGWCEKSGNEDVYMDVEDKDFGLIMANILGEDKVRAEGFLDESKHPKELDDSTSNEFAPVTRIGAEPNSPMGGTYYHKEQTKNEDRQKANNLLEHHLDQRLPFDEPEYANKYCAEQYRDWLEEYGKYGILPPSKLDFWEEIKKAIAYIKENSIKGDRDVSLPKDLSEEEIFKRLKEGRIGPYLKVTNDGKIYVERAVKVDEDPTQFSENGKEELYDRLMRDYGNNVGGCWSYCPYGSRAYCGGRYRNRIVLRGYIRTDDIDYVNTILTNYNYDNQYEIRVKPFAQVQLFNFTYGKYTIRFRNNLIVSSTYFGNNSRFTGNVCKIDDGFGNFTYADRNNNILTKEAYNNELNRYTDELLASGESLKGVFDDYYLNPKTGFASIELSGKINYINPSGKRVSNIWYDGGSSEFSENRARVKLDGKQAYIDENGRRICRWYDECDSFCEDIAVVRLGNKYTYINKEGKRINNEWYDYCNYFRGGFAIVWLGMKSAIINKNGDRICDWYDKCGEFYFGGFAQVTLGNKNNYVNTQGKEIFKNWYENCLPFENGYAPVKIDGKWTYVDQSENAMFEPRYDSLSLFMGDFGLAELRYRQAYIDINGDPISDWYDYIAPLENGFARARMKSQWTFINRNGDRINDIWYRDAEDFKEDGTARVRISKKWSYIDQNGRQVQKEKNEAKDSKKIIMPENKLEVIKENIEPEVASSEVDLSSFKKRDTLPPKIWKDEDTLDSRVRLKLLDIADDFWEFVNLSWVEPKGIIITGSICNFNWSKFSDIDLHIIADFKEIDEKTEFVKQYLDSKKNEWNNEHEGLKIMGFPVELYVQDVEDDIEAGGIYDLEENAWVRKPNPHSIKSIGLNKFSIKDKSAEIMTIIDDMYDKLSSTDDGHEIEQIGDDAHYLWDKVKDLRKKSLSKNGESGSGNIVYKVLRRTGYLDKLFKLFSTVYDRSNSITEGKYYDDLVNNQTFRYRIVHRMADDGYVFHGTGEDGNGVEWENVDPSKIRGGSRATYGYGVYFSNKAYKCEGYIGDSNSHFIIANIKDFNLVNLFDRIYKGFNIFSNKQKEYYILKRELDKTRNNRDYDMISSEIEKYKSTIDRELLDEIVDVINKTDDDKLIYGYLNENIPLLYKMPGDEGKKRLAKLYLSLGIDGFAVYTEFVLFNFEKLNNAIIKNKDKEQLIQKYALENESVKRYLKVLKEEVAMDGSSEGNPYEKRWKAERDALKNFVANYGKLMQSKEDDKGGKLYKVYFDETMSNLIGYNYCICVQWDEQEMKPGSTVYIRALDKFTPFIRRDLQFDTRGRDNMRGTYDDTGY